MTCNNSFSSDKNYPGIAYRGCFPFCSSVMYIKYTPSSQTKKAPRYATLTSTFVFKQALIMARSCDKSEKLLK